jgi:hypothetical protein
MKMIKIELKIIEGYEFGDDEVSGDYLGESGGVSVRCRVTYPPSKAGQDALLRVPSEQVTAMLRFFREAAALQRSTPDVSAIRLSERQEHILRDLHQQGRQSFRSLDDDRICMELWELGLAEKDFSGSHPNPYGLTYCVLTRAGRQWAATHQAADDGDRPDPGKQAARHP